MHALKWFFVCKNILNYGTTDTSLKFMASPRVHTPERIAWLPLSKKKS